MTGAKAPAPQAGDAPVSDAAPPGAPAAPPLGVPPPPPPQDPVQRVRWLNQRIDGLLLAPHLSRAKVGVAVTDIESGRLVYARNEALPLNPASNVKLVTTAAALALLGPEYRFKTAIYVDKEHKGGAYDNLYLRGYGDPTLQVEDLWRISGDIYSHGVRKIDGDILIDDSYFDEQRVGPGFDQKPEDAAFRAPQGAVSLNFNAVGIQVQPGGSDGAPARVVVEPASPYFVVQSEARTSTSGRTNLVVESAEETDAAGKMHTVLRVRGAIRTSDPGQEFFKRVAHPDLYTGFTLRELLQRRGVKLTGKVIHGVAPPTARLLTTHYSPPLGVIAREINKRSNNFMAEQVLKTLGAEAGGKPGTWKKGTDAVGRYLESLGIAAGRYQMTNGSGLYDSNRFSAAQITTLLRTAYRDFRYAADFVGSLGVAGADGTVGHRMTGGLAERYVRAKTGTLLGVSCLSGYASGPMAQGAPGFSSGGRGPLAFSLLMNDLPEDGGATARQVQDGIAELLVLYLGVGPTSALSKEP